MICPVCKSEGKKSKVYSNGVSSTTLLGWTHGYYDENGNYHKNVNPNTISTPYNCSNGHRFTKIQRAGNTYLSSSVGRTEFEG